MSTVKKTFSRKGPFEQYLVHDVKNNYPNIYLNSMFLAMSVRHPPTNMKLEIDDIHLGITCDRRDKIRSAWRDDLYRAPAVFSICISRGSELKHKSNRGRRRQTHHTIFALQEARETLCRTCPSCPRTRRHRKQKQNIKKRLSDFKKFYRDYYYSTSSSINRLIFRVSFFFYVSRIVYYIYRRTRGV